MDFRHQGMGSEFSVIKGLGRSLLKKAGPQVALMVKWFESNMLPKACGLRLSSVNYDILKSEGSCFGDIREYPKQNMTSRQDEDKGMYPYTT